MPITDRFFGSPLIKEYQHYREMGKELNHKIIEKYVNHFILDKAARSLGLGKNRKLVLDSEDDLDVLMDFCLYEVFIRNQNVVQRFEAEQGTQVPEESVLLSAMAGAGTGLFRIEKVMPKQSSLIILDLIQTEKVITLTDINFSRTMPAGEIVFIRPVELPKFAMTSGIAFVFPGEMEEELITLWKKFDKNSSNRYARFFKLSKKKGLETTYVDLGEDPG